MTTINPYLTFKGNCEEAFNFYKSIFGRQFSYLGRYKEMPPTEGMTISAADGEKIMHVSLPISKETILMGDDRLEGFGNLRAGDNFSISISTDSREEADKLFNKLSAGGKVSMAMNKTFWGSYFGQLTDKFGVQWMVSYDQKEKNTKSNFEKTNEFSSVPEMN